MEPISKVDRDIDIRTEDLEAFERVIRIIHGSTIVGAGARDVVSALNILEPLKGMIESELERLRAMAKDGE